MLVGMKLFIILGVGLFFGFVTGRFTASPSESVTAETAASQICSPQSQEVTPSQARGASPTSIPSPTVTQAEHTPAPVSDKTDPAAKDVEPDPEGDSKSETDDSVRFVRPNYRSLESRLAEQLEQSRKRNLKNTIQRSQPVERMTPTLQAMIGRFEGDVLLDDGPTWQMVLETEGKFSGSTFQGKSLTQLSRRGRPFLTNTSDGQLKNFRTTGSGANVLVQISDKFYLDATYDSQTTSIIGNFYEKTATGNYRYRGYAILARH
jgi:hypothetical protein